MSGFSDPEPTALAWYRQKPAEVEAIQWTGKFYGPNYAAIRALVEDSFETVHGCLAIRAESGWVDIAPGDWLLRRNGKVSAMNEGTFARDYECADAHLSPPFPEHSFLPGTVPGA